MAWQALDENTFGSMRLFAALPADWARTKLSAAPALGLLEPYRYLAVHDKGEAKPVEEAAGIDEILPVARHIGAPSADADMPLMAAGLDSLGAVELRNRLQEVAPQGMVLPTTVIFDHPTVRQLAAVVQPGSSESRPAAAAAIKRRTSWDEGVVKLTASRSVLAGGAASPSVWLTVAGGRDLVTVVPSSRWELAPHAAAVDPVALR
eukprot:7057294-Prymnesium_polylepis.1